MTLGLVGQPLLAGNAVSHPCACGELIWCINDDRGIQLGVAAHNRTTPHREWRARAIAEGLVMPDDEFPPHAGRRP